MMTDSTVRLPWGKLPRSAKTRTSYPTRSALKRFVLSIGMERGQEPVVDTVILAAVRVADPTLLRAEIERIEREEFEVPADAQRVEHEPGS